MTIAEAVRTSVAVSIETGERGDPVEIGIVRIARFRDGIPTLTKQFSTPRRDLLGVNFDELSDAEIRRL
jgi:hypothetical protein